MPATDVVATAGTAARPVRRRGWWWVAPPVLLAVLGLVALSRGHGLWYDEVYTAEMARLPLADLARAFLHGEGTLSYLSDAPPSYNAPYYAVVHVWIALTPFGADELGLRLLSLAAAVTAIAVFAFAVDRLAGRRVAVAAGLFAAANPFVVPYAVEARGYALALLGTCVCALGLARWLGDPSHRNLVVFGAGAAAAGVFHWYALLVPAGFAVAAVVLRRRRARPIVVVTALATLPVVALVGVALANGVGASGAEWLRGVGPRVPWLVLRSWSGRSPLLLVATVVTAGAGLSLLGLLRERGTSEGRWRGVNGSVVAAAWVVVPVAVVTAAEQVRPFYVDRYLLPAAIGLAVLMALGANRGRVAVVAVVVAVSLLATFTELRRPPKDDVRAAVAAVAARHRPGDPVVAAARWDALGVDHYVRRQHPELAADLVLPSAPVPAAPTVWVLRRAAGGVKGDVGKLEALDGDLSARGLTVTEEVHYDGRYADVLVQRWEAAQASVRAD